MEQVKVAYELPHKVEQLHYLHAIKDWLTPHIVTIEQHSRPHAFKFEATATGEVGMLYRNWSSKGGWIGDVDGKPFILMKRYPIGAPPLLRGTSIHQHTMDQIEKGVKHCTERFNREEKEWWEQFLQQEQAKRSNWEEITEEQLVEGGAVDWYLDKLEPYREPPASREEENAEVLTKIQVIRKKFEQSTTFKPVRKFCFNAVTFCQYGGRGGGLSH